MTFNFIYSKDTDEERVMHSKTDNTETITYDRAYEVIQKLFESIFFYITNFRRIDEG